MDTFQPPDLRTIAKRWLSVSLRLVNSAVQLLACSLPDAISEARERVLRDQLKEDLRRPHRYD